ncbi:hypothetical protein BH18VER2_BH18VER2_04990 [soil metagenome]
MLTIFAFVLATGSVLTSVWWACKNEVPSQEIPPSDVAAA